MLFEAVRRFQRDEASRLAAALAYFTIFSIAPFLIVVIQIAALVLGGGVAAGHHQVARDAVSAKVEAFAGPAAATALLGIVDATLQAQHGGWIGAIFGWLMLAVAATGLIGTLEDALNTVFGSPPPARGVWGFVRDRGLALASVLAVAVLLLVSIGANAALAAAGSALANVPLAGALLQVAGFVLSTAIVTLLLALLFHYLPSAHPAWGHALRGAAAGALLFAAGQVALAWYLGRVGAASVFGAASALVVLLLWTFYSAQIVLFAAEISAVSVERANPNAAPNADRDREANRSTVG